MYRFLTLVSIATTIASAFFLYGVNYRTRSLEHDLRAAEQREEELAREVQTLKADRAFLARPERIAKAARDLGMRPAQGEQFVIDRPATADSSRAGTSAEAPDAVR